ncbi:tafazzin-like [Megalopta genalis]|uniref:tafazzin-like n=1 Tax=Megalopta genalis TaxID=115081 RepID=UPI003FD5BDB2
MYVCRIGIGSSQWLNKATVYNKHIMTRALDCRPKNVPLITISNHHSCFDDPGIWDRR